jgi:S-adenosylmethionine:tRNA ribosyltransferase-isomerase
MYLLEDYNYDLPEHLIAHYPKDKRDQSKLLVLNRNSGEISHSLFFEIENYLAPGDVLVINNTEVIPARLFGKKETGGTAEVLILDYANGLRYLEEQGEFICDCLVKSSKKPKIGQMIYFDLDLSAKVIDRKENFFKLHFSCGSDFLNVLYKIGKVPLPPYIKRDRDNSDFNDKNAYQTIYAKEKGAVAAPTAGFHFTSSLLEKLKLKGINVVEITLHVGYGTFFPVRELDIRNHKIHSEWFYISKTAAGQINGAKSKRGRVFAVGTTTVRTLEYASSNNGEIQSKSGNCDLFIFPGYKFKIVDAMITNFHLPKSSLLMLVSAFAGREKILNAYNEAIKNEYRFYSYGDAMLIE